MNDLFRNKFESFLKTSSNYFKNFTCDCLSKNGQMVSPIETSVSVRKWQVFGIRTIEQHRLTFFGTQHHKFRCNTRILNQACMLFSDSRLLENDVFHLPGSISLSIWLLHIPNFFDVCNSSMSVDK